MHQSAAEAHNATLKAELERRDAQLAAAGADLAHERERADKAIAAAEARAEREADKAGKAIEASAHSPIGLDALAATRARPWWRLLG